MKDFSLYLMHQSILKFSPSEAIIYWPHKEGWWGDPEVIAGNYNPPPFPYYESSASFDGPSLFERADSIKVIEFFDLPLYIGWSYVSAKMTELIKGTV